MALEEVLHDLCNDLLHSSFSETRVVPDFSSLAEYASTRAGGDIVLPLTTPTILPRGSLIHCLLCSGPQPSSPWAALSDDMQSQSCWLLGGNINQVVVDHIVGDTSTAPRQMILWGLVNGRENLALLCAFHAKPTSDMLDISEKCTFPAISGSFTFIPLSYLEYNIHATNLTQTFPMCPFILDSGMDFGVVVLEILGNWGNTSMCLYCFRVYG
ncbi:hypothetical protein F5141DRAFT_1010552 [Pisolithus sp. B1]|nr:hypothetical protein F5141DRAFT_1010474 [Pisolithus sp. B1]KAI6099077.1 hypothetical protein F5141DRAFT_1010552 [Pisolithus sp. B1]